MHLLMNWVDQYGHWVFFIFALNGLPSDTDRSEDGLCQILMLSTSYECLFKDIAATGSFTGISFALWLVNKLGYSIFHLYRKSFILFGDILTNGAVN